LVGKAGFEPAASCSQSRRAAKLRYFPSLYRYTRSRRLETAVERPRRSSIHDVGTIAVDGRTAVAYEWIIDGLDETWTSIDRLLRPLSNDAYDTPTPCPGWSVRDVVSHLVGFELMLQGERVPELVFDEPPYVHNPIGEINEQFVQQRRTRSGLEVLNEFRDVSRRSLDRLRQLSLDQWESVGWSPEGDVAHHRFQETRILDSWIHLQDLRDGLLQPADDHGVGEEIVVNRFEAAMAYVVGKKVGAANGTTVRFSLTGRLARIIVIEVVDGRARAAATLDGDPSVEITTPVALFWRRCAGRVASPAFLTSSATSVAGDRDLARRVSDAMAIMI
jgi:uncharacterized protein (TIGR03083 family)